MDVVASDYICPGENCHPHRITTVPIILSWLQNRFPSFYRAELRICEISCIFRSKPVLSRSWNVYFFLVLSLRRTDVSVKVYPLSAVIFRDAFSDRWTIIMLVLCCCCYCRWWWWWYGCYGCRCCYICCRYFYCCYCFAAAAAADIVDDAVDTAVTDADNAAAAYAVDAVDTAVTGADAATVAAANVTAVTASCCCWYCPCYCCYVSVATVFAVASATRVIVFVLSMPLPLLRRPLLSKVMTAVSPIVFSIHYFTANGPPITRRIFPVLHRLSRWCWFFYPH